jgi:hypothetical protein
METEMGSSINDVTAFLWRQFYDLRKKNMKKRRGGANKYPNLRDVINERPQCSNSDLKFKKRRSGKIEIPLEELGKGLVKFRVAKWLPVFQN